MEGDSPAGWAYCSAHTEPGPIQEGPLNIPGYGTIEGQFDSYCLGDWCGGNYQ